MTLGTGVSHLQAPACAAIDGVSALTHWRVPSACILTRLRSRAYIEKACPHPHWTVQATSLAHRSYHLEHFRSPAADSSLCHCDDKCQVPPAVVLCSSVRRTDSPSAFLTGSERAAVAHRTPVAFSV